MRKYDRQRIILSLIEDNIVETQEELTQLLKENGITATQATISRDIKELRITKVQTENGVYKYTVIDTMYDTLNERYNKIFKASILSIKEHKGKIIISTISYAASVTAQALVNKKIEGIAYTLAGHDTILVEVDENHEVSDVIEKIKETLY
ncbi:arginine repressor [Helcococcus kunzii]|uniref:Arginine repressor n=1 Tax=Helcococcus kunzii ATCC 51366 TaxID=883114 RepID=H3NN70_9FIRM|nr:arginine repressor [Helcococcus kunzii]EHR34474.1 arginine repressor [Helcococcus kunzii ATCC 51366]MCT1795473.1 arginine repressor [Helcococcus kunzii]MCT1989617.1 arginine repressor [Helcococcus kunzii]QUY64719.1 arginine repressor [Helcococcus kunzii]QZO77128.1 arginine repressor [Helcococcus kunzii]